MSVTFSENSVFRYFWLAQNRWAHKALRQMQHGFSLIGLIAACLAVTLATQPQLRQSGAEQLKLWLQNRSGDSEPVQLDSAAASRATVANLKDLPLPQASLAYWLSKKYHVAPEPVGALVAEAYASGLHTKLEPTLILAIIAVQSGFNPFAQSSVGAQGLMQIKANGDAVLNQLGGKLATFDPIGNLRAGAKVLEDCVARTGSVAGGLHCYASAASPQNADESYTTKVLSEYARLQQVAHGNSVALATLPVGLGEVKLALR